MKDKEFDKFAFDLCAMVVVVTSSLMAAFLTAIVIVKMFH